ncbi:cation:proton antiporter [Streptococcus ferus]|uniref:cation:proton antiporter n=1 Tax=Streptococcus ferus TaxID=1345 RepID=UPI00359F163D
MTLPLLIITFLFTLIFSNILNRIFPKLPLPLIQIVLGIIIGLANQRTGFSLNTDLFLALVVAPLSFREGQESDLSSFLRYRSIITYLILPTVFVTAILLGLAAHFLLPASISMAACFALGAALGPTDAVAFISLSKRFAFPKRLEDILKMEGLLNDASGLVAFQFATAAMLTGAFSLSQASIKLLLAISGGFLIGLFFALLDRLLLILLERFDAADVTGTLLLELSLPIVSYLVASLFDVSGIIAVVIAGLSQANRRKRINLFDAEVDRVGQVVWSTVSFLLNGFVFIIFGYELTRIVESALSNPLISNQRLMLLVSLFTLLLFLLRFTMISLFFAYRYWRKKGRKRYNFQNSLILTFSGVKGTMSIATILLLPQIGSYEYSLILFTVGSVTLLSFLMGVLVLPLIAPPKQEEADIDYIALVAILNEVVDLLEEELSQTEQKLPLYMAIDAYNERIKYLILEQENKGVKQELAYLQMMILEVESDGLEYAYQEGQISIDDYRIYQRYLKYLERRINRGLVSSFYYVTLVSLRIGRFLIREFFTLVPTLRRFLKGKSSVRRLNRKTKENLSHLYLSNTELVLESLENLEGVYNQSLIAFLQRSRLQEAQIIESGLFVERIIARLRPDNSDEMLRGFYLERKVIAEYERKHVISKRFAKRLRNNVNNLESFSLKESDDFIPLDLTASN